MVGTPGNWEPGVPLLAGLGNLAEFSSPRRVGCSARRGLFYALLALCGLAMLPRRGIGESMAKPSYEHDAIWPPDQIKVMAKRAVDDVGGKAGFRAIGPTMGFKPSGAFCVDRDQCCVSSPQGGRSCLGVSTGSLGFSGTANGSNPEASANGFQTLCAFACAWRRTSPCRPAADTPSSS